MPLRFISDLKSASLSIAEGFSIIWVSYSFPMLSWKGAQTVITYLFKIMDKIAANTLGEALR